MINKYRRITAGKGFIYAAIIIIIPFGIPALLIYEAIKNRKVLFKNLKNGSNKN